MKFSKIKKLLFIVLILILSTGSVAIFNWNGIKNLYYANIGYTQDYIDYLNLTNEEKLKVNLVPEKYEVCLTKTDLAYASQMSSLAESTGLPAYYNLRDEVTIYTENQGQNGLCWAYAGIKSLETFLALNYGEYWNLSEGYVAYANAKNNTYYQTWGGGNWSAFTNSIYNKSKTEYGVLSETYFSYDDIYSMNRANLKYYSFLEQNADLNYDNITQPVTISASTSNFDVIKEHIMQNGSLYTPVNSVGIYEGENGYTVSNTKTYGGDHAVSIIGWDDNFSRLNFPSSIRPAQDGAFIALNSWGNFFGDEGIYYISYEDVQVTASTLYGITPLNNSTNDYLVFSEFNSPTSTYSISEKTTNIFNLGDDIELDYVLCNSSNDAVDVGVKIEKNDVDITRDFSIINTKNSANTSVYITSNEEMEAGTYIVQFRYKNETYNRSFVVASGAELDFIIANTGHGKMYNTINGQSKTFSAVKESRTSGGNTIYYANMYIYVTSLYSDIVEINVDDTYIFTYDGNYSRYYFYDITLTKQIYDLNVVTSSGYTETYKVFFINYSYLNYFYINYNLNGGVNNALNPRMFDNVSGTYTLYEPTKTNYTFAGWYVNQISDETLITEFNSTSLNDILLVAKWIEEEDSNVFLQCLFKNEDGEEVSKESLIYGCTGQFSTDFSYLNETNLTYKWYFNTIYNSDYDNLINISANLLAGTHTITCEAIKNDNVLGYQMTDFQVQKKELILEWENFSFSYNGQNQLPTLNIIGLVGDDEYPVTLKYFLTGCNEITLSTKIIGTYEVSVTNLTSSNYFITENYQTTFTISPKLLTITATNVTAKFSSEKLDVANSYTVDGEIYENDVVYIDVFTNAQPHVSGVYDIIISTNANNNYIFTIVNGSYTVLDGSIITYNLPNGEIISTYVDEGEKLPNVNDVYKSSILTFVYLNTISTDEAGNATYEIIEVSLLPYLMALLILVGACGTIISTIAILKNKKRKMQINKIVNKFKINPMEIKK